MPLKALPSEFYLFISCYEITYYVLSLLYYFFIKNIKRKDDTIMFIHHIATIILIIISNLHHNHNSMLAGLYVLLIHNICDIFLNLYMLLKYITTIPNILKNINIGFGVFIFFYSRLILFGSLICYVIIYPTESDFITSLILFIIYGFDIYWCFLIATEITNELLKKNDDKLYVE